MNCVYKPICYGNFKRWNWVSAWHWNAFGVGFTPHQLLVDCADDFSLWRLLSASIDLKRSLNYGILKLIETSLFVNKIFLLLLPLFKGCLLRAIYGPVRVNNDWRIRYNSELYNMYKELYIIGFIKIGRLQWAGHVMRMDESRPARRVFLSDPGGNRVRGRPKSRWEDYG